MNTWSAPPPPCSNAAISRLSHSDRTLKPHEQCQHKPCFRHDQIRQPRSSVRTAGAPAAQRRRNGSTVRCISIVTYIGKSIWRRHAAMSCEIAFQGSVSRTRIDRIYLPVHPFELKRKVLTGHVIDRG